MPLLRMIYISKVVRQIRFADVEAIADKASELNRRADLTGLLVYTPSHFIQVLEGPPENLTATFERIKRDERHTRVRVLDRTEVEQRQFGSWGMRATMLPAGISALELELESLDGKRALDLLLSCARA